MAGAGTDGAVDGPHELGPPRADEPGEAQDLAFPHLQRDALDAGRLELADAQRHRRGVEHESLFRIGVHD